MIGFFRRLCGPKNVMSDRWLAEQGHRESRIEFHGSGRRWRFNRVECDAAWLNRYRLRNETQEQERKRA